MLKRLRNSFKGKKDGAAAGGGGGQGGAAHQTQPRPGANQNYRNPGDVKSMLMARTIVRRSSVSNFLTSPVTDVTFNSGGGCGLTFGEASMQGWRSHMEDAFIAVMGIEGLPGWSFFAVLDGHAGKQVALHSAKTLTAVCAEYVQPVRFSPRGCMDGLRRAFLKHDKNLESNFEILRDQSGATCTSVLIGPRQIVFSNIGDSRSLLSRGGRVIVSTLDHKPTDSKEMSRICDAGGRVFNGRVDGGLALSRAFGDFEYKMRSDLPAVRQKVSAEPDCIFVHRRPGLDEFVLLACDGLWDVTSNEQVAAFVRRALAVKPPQTPQHICTQLVKIALDRGSRDNVTVLLVVIPKGATPSAVGQASSAAPPPAASKGGPTLATPPDAAGGDGDAAEAEADDKTGATAHAPVPVATTAAHALGVVSNCAMSSVVYAMRVGIDLACAHIRVQQIRELQREAAARKAEAAEAHRAKPLLVRKSSFDASVDTLKRLPINMGQAMPAVIEGDGSAEKSGAAAAAAAAAAAPAETRAETGAADATAAVPTPSPPATNSAAAAADEEEGGGGSVDGGNDGKPADKAAGETLV